MVATSMWLGAQAVRAYAFPEIGDRLRDVKCSGDHRTESLRRTHSAILTFSIYFL